MKLSKMLSFLSLKNNSETTGLNFLLDSYLLSSHQTPLRISFSLLDYSLLNFHKHHPWYVNNQ